jgi:hypothetical protein
MQPDDPTCRSRDILASPWRALVVFWIPAIAIIVTANQAVSNNWRTTVWTIALGTMGVACVANALRCGRLHCYLTGPFFLVMAAITLIYGLGILPQRRNGWGLIGITVLAGGIAFCCVPEAIWGKYRKTHPQA